MGLCFSLGSRRNSFGNPLIQILHSIEYLVFNFIDKQIELCGDFIIHNVSNKNARLRGLHRGNIQFEFATSGWIADTRCTKTLMVLARDDIGLQVTRNQILLHHVTGEIDNVVLLSEAGQPDQWGPEAPKVNDYTYFTTWTSPVVKPGELGLFRIKGTIEGQTYGHLLKDPDMVRITGGWPLDVEIQDDFVYTSLEKKADYKESYYEFMEQYHQEPQFYHVFLENTEGKHFRLINSSTDIRRRYLNEKINGRMVSWFWSDSDYCVHAGAKGPSLVLDTQSTDTSNRVGD